MPALPAPLNAFVFYLTGVAPGDGIGGVQLGWNLVDIPLGPLVFYLTGARPVKFTIVTAQRISPGQVI